MYRVLLSNGNLILSPKIMALKNNGGKMVEVAPSEATSICICIEEYFSYIIVEEYRSCFIEDAFQIALESGFMNLKKFPFRETAYPYIAEAS